MTREDALERYARFYAELTPEGLEELRHLCREDVRFRDPFNDFRGVERLIALYADMFDQLDTPAFEITDRALGRQACYLRWIMTFRRKGSPWRIEGVSEIRFDEDGRVAAHLDHWDAGDQFYAKLPILGAVIRWIQRKLAA